MQADIIEVRADGRPRERREYSEAFKRRIVASTYEPGASVARIARRQGLNANLVFTWRRDSRYQPVRNAAALLPVRVIQASPVTVPSPQVPASEVDTNQAYIEVEVRGTRLRLHGAVDLGVLSAVFGLIEGRQ